MPLNTNQKRAVEYLDGPLLVLAGPGTGKTQLLSEKVAYILKNTDTNPENILCLTFTDSGASNMRERLKTIINGTYRWHKVYLVIDSVAGTIDFYIDGDKVGTYTSYVKTGVKAISAKLRTNNDSNDNYRFRIRNIMKFFIIILNKYFIYRI